MPNYSDLTSVYVTRGNTSGNVTRQTVTWLQQADLNSALGEMRA